MELITELQPGEARLFDGDEDVECHRIEMLGGQAMLHYSKSPSRDSPSEDAAAIFAATDASGFLAVADGVGGARAGKLASTTALECLIDSARAGEPGRQSLRDSILDGFEAANEAVREAAPGAATTLNVVEIDDRTVRSFHAGDSLTVVAGQRSRVKMQVIPHSPVGYGLESGLLDEMDALHSDERHLVSNVVGSPDLRIDVGPRVRLATRDTLVLASDGLSDNLEMDEILGSVRTGPLDRALARLSQLARARMVEDQPGKPSKPDDLTILIFRLTAR